MKFICTDTALNFSFNRRKGIVFKCVDNYASDKLFIVTEKLSKNFFDCNIRFRGYDRKLYRFQIFVCLRQYFVCSG